MPKCLLFAGHKHYPLGGIDDLKGTFDSLPDALKWFEKNPDQISDSYLDHWCQIVDKETLIVLGRFKQSFIGGVSDGVPGPITVDEDDA
jgi:hypothetical protein